MPEPEGGEVVPLGNLDDGGLGRRLRSKSTPPAVAAGAAHGSERCCLRCCCTPADVEKHERRFVVPLRLRGFPSERNRRCREEIRGGAKSCGIGCWIGLAQLMPTGGPHLTGVTTPLTHLFSVMQNYSCYFSPSIHRKQRWQLSGSGMKLVTRRNSNCTRFCFAFWWDTWIPAAQNLTG